jgi:putative lipoprotein
MALPADAILEVTLLDTSRADSPATVIATQKIPHPGNPPFRFTLTYDPAKIIPSHTYAVRATIHLGAQLMYSSTAAHQVITNGNPDRVNIGLQRTFSEDTSGLSLAQRLADEKLEDTFWQLTALGGKPVAIKSGQRQPSLVLRSTTNQFGPHRAEVFGGCNTMNGNYTLKSSSLTFGPLAGTLKACPEGLDTEKEFAAALASTSTWKIHANHLELYDDKEKLAARFESRPLQ